ncbi:MAG: lipolytic enzyme, partial [Chthonomonadales bacterium]|nr:lipolytic enzyme [Chthonomonadales bacterium]
MHWNPVRMCGLSRALSALSLLFLPTTLRADTPPADPARFAAEVAALVARDAAEQLPQNGILFIGSSNIRKWPLKTGFPTLTLINNGFGGS